MFKTIPWRRSNGEAADRRESWLEWAETEGAHPEGPKATRGAWLIRGAVALVWLYEGLWCKLLGGAARQRAIVEAAPFVGPARATAALLAIGAAECGLGLWALSGRRGRAAAIAQTAALAAMNAAGIVWGGAAIPDAAGMLMQNAAFLVLAWVAAGAIHA
jgi:hypothetical protein